MPDPEKVTGDATPADAPETTAPAPEPATEPAAPDPRVAELEARVAQRETEWAERLAERERELVDRLARLQADFENFRRRAREDAAAAQARGKEAFLRELLPLLDNLDRALAHTEDEGLRLLARQLQSALQAQGVAVLDPQGAPFDAKLHEAVAQEAREGAEAGTVLAVVEKGYAMDGRVLRPARVIVAS